MEKMKVMYKIAAIILILLLPAYVSARNEAFEKSKKIEKTYPLSPATYVEIYNKYGDIEVELWDKDSIKLEIFITVHSDKEEDLDGMFNLVSINLKATKSFILASTEWSEEVGLFKKGILKFNQELTNNTKYVINYKIKLPQRTDLSITNKFGNIFMTNYNGRLSIDLSYGDLRAHQLSNVKQLTAKYGKVKLKGLSVGRVDLQSVKPFDVDKSVELDMKSSSSEIEIDNINILNLESSHDEVSIGEIDILNVTASMSDIKTERLGTKMQATSKYGSIKLLNLNSSCERIQIEATKTDIELILLQDFDANAEFILSEKSNLTTNVNYTETSTEVDSNGYYNSKGRVNAGANTELYIKNINGYIELDKN